MPQKLIVDLETLDLEHVVAERAELRGYLRQRGTFEMLDGVLHHDVENGLAIAFKEIREDDWWAPDHIPGRPIFPGALMIESAAQLASYDYLKYRGGVAEGKFLGFGGTDGTRFRGIVSPPCRMLFVARVKRTRPTMFRYETQGFVDGKLVFESDVIGVAV